MDAAIIVWRGYAHLRLGWREQSRQGGCGVIEEQVQQQEELRLRWMRRAIELATENVRSGAGGPFGAVIVRGDVMVAEGANLVTATNDPTAHAEVIAIRRACSLLGTYELGGCAIYCSCEPCPMCLSAIYWARLDVIYHGSTAEDAAAVGFDDARLYGEFATERAQRAIPCLPLLREEAGASFAAWAVSPMRLPY
jgi:tRNA(Arg) A34 adenosine deaminase TadA